VRVEDRGLIHGDKTFRTYVSRIMMTLTTTNKSNYISYSLRKTFMSLVIHVQGYP